MFVKDWDNYLDEAQRGLALGLVKPDASDASLCADWLVAALEGSSDLAAVKIVNAAFSGEFGLDLRNKLMGKFYAEVQARALAAETEEMEAA